MNLDLLKSECISATKEAFEDYKHFIVNAIFEVNDDLIQLHIDEMKQSAGRKVNGFYIKHADYTPELQSFINGLLKGYMDIAVKKAYGFGNRYKTIN